MGKQKPYGSKMEKFDVVGRSRGAHNLPIYLINQTLGEKLRHGAALLP